MIIALWMYFWKLCLSRQHPENCPYSPFLLGLSGMLLTLLFVIQWWFSDLDGSEDLLLLTATAITVIFSYLLYTYVLMYVRGLSHRAVQTLTCLYSCHLIIHLFALPLILLAPYLSQSNLNNPILLLIGVIYLFFTLGLSVWQFIVTAYIYKYALNCTPVQSVLSAFGLIAVNILTLSFWR